MIRAQLVVTGDMELGALAASLRHAFPEHKFEFLQTLKVQDFTSIRLGSHPGRVPGQKTRAQQLAQTLVSAFDPGQFKLPQIWCWPSTTSNWSTWTNRTS